MPRTGERISGAPARVRVIAFASTIFVVAAGAAAVILTPTLWAVGLTVASVTATVGVDALALRTAHVGTHREPISLRPIGSGGPSTGAALGDPKTAKRLSRYGRNGAIMLVLGLSLFIGGVVAASISSNGATHLLRTGTRTRARITALYPGQDGGAMGVVYVAKGASHRAVITLTASSPHWYAAGKTVTVVYDPDKLSDVRTTLEQNQTPVTTDLVIFGLVGGLGFLIGGVVTRVRSRRWRKILRRGSWEPWHYTQRKRVMSLSRDEQGHGALAVKRANNARFASRALQASSGIVWVARDPHSNRFVLASPDLKALATGRAR
jgi:hypothetical protein